MCVLRSRCVYIHIYSYFSYNEEILRWTSNSSLLLVSNMAIRELGHLNLHKNADFEINIYTTWMLIFLGNLHFGSGEIETYTGSARWFTSLLLPLMAWASLLLNYLYFLKWNSCLKGRLYGKRAGQDIHSSNGRRLPLPPFLDTPEKEATMTHTVYSLSENPHRWDIHILREFSEKNLSINQNQRCFDNT